MGDHCFGYKSSVCGGRGGGGFWVSGNTANHIGLSSHSARVRAPAANVASHAALCGQRVAVRGLLDLPRVFRD